MLEQSGSIERYFLEAVSDADEDVGVALFKQERLIGGKIHR